MKNPIRIFAVSVAISMFIAVVFGACSGDGDVPAETPVATSTPEIPDATPSTPLAPVFAVATIDGETIRLEDLVGKVPLYVFFVPTAVDEIDRQQMSVIQSRFDTFEQLGASVVAVVSDLPTDVIEVRDEMGLEFALIADPLGVVAADWQVSDLFGDGGGGPASFVFDAHGTLIARLVAGEPVDRPTVDEVLRVIAESVSAGSA